MLLGILFTVPVQAQQAAVPGAPTGLTATAVGETTINLAWTAPADNGGAAIIGYQIEVWVAGGMHWAVLEDDTESTGTDYAHTGLMDGRTRYYRVSAINSVGAGATSNVASATTTDMMAPQFSGNAGDTSVPVNGTDVLLQFDESLDRGAGRVPLASAFTVTADGVAIAVDGVHVEGTVVRLALDGVITKDQSVTVSYRDPTPGDDQAAIQDYAGNDAASFADHTISSGRNKSVVLGAPTNLTATVVSATQIDLSWEAPAGFTPTGYRIEVSADGGTTWTDRVANTGSTDTAYSHTGLTLRDTHHYRVSAISGTSPALPSNVATATAVDPTDSTPPAFDRNHVLTRVDGLGVDLFLLYNEGLDDSAGRTPPASAFTVTADGSTVTVTEVRIVGSLVLLVLDPVITIHQTVRVSYGDPTPGDDAAAIQDFAGNDAASFTDFKFPSNSQLSEILGAPTNLTATAISATQIDLAWEAPAAFTPTGYRIEVSADGGTTWTDRVANTGSTATAYSHTDLTLGDTRHYRVSAVLDGRTALASNVASATTMDSIPPAFDRNHVLTRVDGLGVDLFLLYNEGLDDSAGRTPPASAFTVTADGSTVTVTEVRIVGSLVLLVLDPVITIHQTVRVSYGDPTPGDDAAAIQDFAGNDAASFTDFKFPSNSQLSEILGAPTNLTATAISATQIDLAWEAPAAFTPTGYRIEVSADGGTTWTDRVADTESTATDYSHTGLTLRDTRHYRVSAVLDGRTALASNVASATAFDTADSTPPAFDRNHVLTRVDGLGVDLFLLYNEGLDDSAGRTPPASAFTVTADGSTVTVTEVRIVGSLVLLVLDPVITIHQTVRVSYGDPTPGDDAAAIQDFAGNDAASFTDFKFPSNSQLSEILGAPTNLTATGVSATQIDLAWEAPAGFTPTGYRIEVSTDGGTTWTDRVANTESTDTDYSHTGLTLHDTRHYRVSAVLDGRTALASNVANATAFDTTDTTPPAVLDSPSLNTVTGSGVELILAFNEVLDGRAGRLPPASAFTVTADGSTVTVTEALVVAQSVRLVLDGVITNGQTVTVSYRDPTPGDDPAAIQDYAGNDAASFTDQAITNNSDLRQGPTNLRATRRSLNETDLSWQAPADFVPESYRVEGSNNLPDLWTTLVNEVDDPTDTVFSHYDPFPDPTLPYRYRVWAVSSTVESVVSNTAAAGPDRVPPVFDPEHRDTSVLSDGTAITLQFNEFLVDPPPWSAFTVTVDGIPVQQGRVTIGQDQIRLTGFESPIGGGRVVRVSYRDLTPGDDPAAVQDAAGNDAASFTDVVVKNSSWVLPAPTNLRATGIDDTRIELAWNAPDLSGLVWPEHRPGTGIYGYRIEASTDGGTTWTTLVSTDNRATSYVHTGLAHGAVRHYRVSALNVGNFAGLPSNVAGAIASDTQPPSLKSAATNQDGTEVNLTFTEAVRTGSGFGPPASAFTVTADGTPTTVGTVTSGSTSVLLRGLGLVIRQGQTVTASYRDPTPGDDQAALQDDALNDVASFTDWPVTNQSTVAPTAPGAPANLKARARGDTRIDLSWDAPGDTGGRAIDGYKIEVSSDNGNTWTDRTANTGSADTAYSHTSLTSGSTRHYRVSAINAVGTGAVSNVANATAGSGPATPESVSATGAYARVGVTWDAVTGATGYTVQWKSGEESFSSARETAVTTNSATVSPLANGAAFMVRVSASNTAGDSEWSGAVTAATPVLAAPANVVATRGDGRLDVSWDAVAGAERYKVQWTSGGRAFADSREITAETNAATVPDLANGTTYTLRVRAANAGGESDWSATETGMPQVPAPETPENLKVTAGDTNLAVTWDAVPVAAEYTVQWKSGTEEFDSERQLTVTVNTATVPGLVNGTTYTLRVQAANAGGESGWSETATGTPTPLGVPANMEVTAWDGRVAVCFDEVVGATEYTVQWRTDTEAYSEDRQKTVFETSETMDCGEGRLSTTVHRLANETLHWFRVRASNSWWDEGIKRKDSLWSAEVTATPTATAAAPANLVVTPGDGRLDVSWDAVEGADSYTVEWRQSGTVREQEETTHAVVLTGLVNGTTYSLRVKAANEVGEGPWSAPARGRPDPLGHPPEVSITLGAGPPVDGAFAVKVTFSEAVTGFEVGDLAAGYVGGPGVVVRGFEEEQTGLVYSAMVPAPRPGKLVISVGPGKAAALSDSQGNALGALVVEVGAAGNPVAVSGPVVTGVLMSTQSGSGRQDGFGTRSVAARGSSGSGGSVRVTVTFSEPVTVDLSGGTPTIGLMLGGGTRKAPYSGGTETETLLFVYTLTGEDGSVTGGSVTQNSLTLNGATIRSWSGEDADLGHPGAALGDAGGGELPALTARFEAAPEAHDGAGTFTVRLVFSEPVAISYQTLRDESLSAAGGSVEGARRVEGRSDLWEITLKPASDEPVTLTLAAGRACDTPGAVCTADGRRLSNEAVLTVPGPAGDGPELTGQFENVPEAHDGQSAFSFQVAFSEDIGISYQALRDESFTVTGGTITRARRVDGRHDLWEITIKPDSREAVTITLPGGRACGTAGAVCTRGDDPQPLGNSPSSTVAGPPAESLTASFSDMPGEHTGEAFSFGLTFSEELDKDFSYRTLRDEAFAVTGGTVRGAKRREQGSNLGWTITVEPDSDGAVTLRLPETTDCGASGAVCTGDGRPLSTSLSATVAGLVGISVADARVEEGAGAVLAFAVTLERAAGVAVTVDYATSDGTAQAGVDYTATSGTLTFDAGDTEKTVEVPVLDDSHDEGDEALTLRLSNASGGRLADAEATGTIENTDPLPRALLARFGRATALHVMEQVEERLDAPRAPGLRGRFAGRELRRGMEREMGRNFLSRLESTAVQGARDTTGVQPDLGGAELLRMGLGGGDLLMGSGFVLNRETDQGASVSLWSRGMESRFSGRDGELSLDGGVRTTMFGADYAKGPLMAGLMLSHRRGLGGYQGADVGQVASSVTGLHPWVGYKLTERVTLWGVTGYGKGSLSLTPGEALSVPTSSLTSPVSLNGGLSMSMLAGGVRGDLVDAGLGGFGLAFKADALWVGTGSEAVDGPAGRLAATEAVVTRVRTALEASRGYVVGHGIALRPSLEVGLRKDGGDAETGTGADVAASLIAADPWTGLSVDVRVRTLLVHQDEGFRERGVSVSFSYDPTPSTPLGLTARVAPSWGGQAMSGADALWGRDTMTGLGAAGPGSGNRLDAELGYALPVGSRLVGTPRFGVTTSEYGRDYRLGYKLTLLQAGAMNFEFGLDAQRRQSLLGQGDPEHSLHGRVTARW